jgi:1-acyl-sn-glycerol-3-phosphate acyltransferase
MSATADIEREQAASTVLELARGLAREIHGRDDGRRLDLDSALDTDFGLESLARAELLRRVEGRFGVELPETLLAAATPADLVAGLLLAGRRSGTFAEQTAIEAQREPGGFASAGTLAEVLERHLERRPDQLHIRLLGGREETPIEITYAALARDARAIAGGLIDAGLAPRSTVAIMLPTSPEYYATFFGVILAGCIPVPIYPPARPAQLEEHLTRHTAILNNAETALLITVEEARRAAQLLRAGVPSVRKVLTPGELMQAPAPIALPRIEPSDVAFIQYTSGSTGNPRGVVLTHANLLANLRAIGRAIEIRSDDLVVSWLPLYHDMGLIGTWLGSFYFALPLVAMPPQHFLARPAAWLRAMSAHRGTISASPNFGYELCVAKVDESEDTSLDLSPWRLAMNGAEPVNADTIGRFTERFSRCGFRREAMAPVYGLAEATLAVTAPPPGRGPLIEEIDRDSFTREGIARPAREPAGALRFVGCGKPLPGYRVRVVGPGDFELPDRHQGRIQILGPSVTSGYYRNVAETRRILRGEWLESGDLGYSVGGELFVTGRSKDLIIRAGRHFHPQEIEQAIGMLAGIRKGCVAAFGAADRSGGTERFVIVAETRERDRDRLASIEAAVRSEAVRVGGAPPDDIVLAPPHTVLKTSSGKIRRSATRDLYEQGELGTGTRPLWMQLLRLYGRSVGPAGRRLRRLAGELAWAAYVWGVGFAVAPWIWSSIVLAPRLPWRRALLHRQSRWFLRTVRVPVAVEGLENLPGGPFVLASNHASYLDGIVVAAVVPPPLRFVVKSEFVSGGIATLFFSRIGALFVHRTEAAIAVEEAGQLEAAAKRGESIAIFPEGGLQRLSGVRPFRMGAFVAAAAAGLPVVPIGLRGTRDVLRVDEWMPRRAGVTVAIGKPLPPHGSDWEAAVDLSRRTREAIVALSGDPAIQQH